VIAEESPWSKDHVQKKVKETRRADGLTFTKRDTKGAGLMVWTRGEGLPGKRTAGTKDFT